MEKIEEKYGSCHDCQLGGLRHCAHADTCGNAKEYPMPLRKMVKCVVLILTQVVRYEVLRLAINVLLTFIVICLTNCI